MTHGMVLVRHKDGDGSLVVTCLCGWFDPELQHKVDMGAIVWQEHYAKALMPDYEACGHREADGAECGWPLGDTGCIAGHDA